MANSNAYNTGKIFDGYMGRNRIINGACNVAQRGSFVASTGLNGYGGPDRYQAINLNSAGGQFTQSQGTITIGGVTKNAVAQTVNTAISSTTGTNVWVGIDQNIEGFNCYDLLGQQVSISFIFNTNVSGTYSLSLKDGTSANSYVTSFTAVANTPTKYTFSIATIGTSFGIANTTSTGLIVNIGALNTGTFQTSTLNAWQSGNFISVSGATNWGASTNNFIAVTELQLEEGAIATPFERESIATTIAKCQRYFCKTFPLGTIPGNNQGNVGALFINGVAESSVSYTGQVWYFPTTMRIAPTITTYNYTTGTASYWHDAAGTGDSQPNVNNAINENHCFILLANGSPYTAPATPATAWYIHATATAEF